MSLVADAHRDFQEIMRSELGASWDCTITNPAGVSALFKCRFSNTAQQINPGTNEVASGKQLVISVLLADLETAGFLEIQGIPDEDRRPWLVAVDDVIGRPGVYKITESNPDSTLGNVVLWCEMYKELG